MIIETFTYNGWEIVKYADCWNDILDQGWKLCAIEGSIVIMQREKDTALFRQRE